MIARTTGKPVIRPSENLAKRSSWWSGRRETRTAASSRCESVMSENERDTMKRLLEEDDAPPWSDEVFKRAELREGDKVIRRASGTLTRRGRPKLEKPKRQGTLRRDAEGG